MANRRDRGLRWESVPSELHYLRPVVERYGDLGMGVPYDEVMGRHVRWAERATPEQLAELAPICERLCRDGDLAALRAWIDASGGGRPSVGAVAGAMSGLLNTLAHLAEMGREPFASAWVVASDPEPDQAMDPSKLPETLRPFVALFEKWGDVLSDTTRYKLLDRAEADPSEMEELKDFHARLDQIEPATYVDWLNPKEAWNHEQAKVNFTLMLLYAELEIEKQ